MHACVPFVAVLIKIFNLGIMGMGERSLNISEAIKDH